MPSLLEDDETVDVGLKQLWPTQAAWNVVFHSVTTKSLRQEWGVPPVATGEAPQLAPAEDARATRAPQPGEDPVLAPSTPGDDPLLGDDLTERVLRELRDEGLPDADDLEILVEEQQSPATNVPAAKAGEQRAAEIRRRRAEKMTMPGGETLARATAPTGEDRETVYVGDMKVRLPRPGDAAPQLQHTAGGGLASAFLRVAHDADRAERTQSMRAPKRQHPAGARPDKPPLKRRTKVRF